MSDTTMTANAWSLRFPLGPGWFTLPVRGDGETADLEAQVDARIEREPELAERRQELVNMVTHFARDAKERGAVGAALLWARDKLDGAMVATLYTAVYERSTGEPADRYLDILRHQLTTKYANDRIEPKVEIRELPAGKFLRVQVIADTEPLPGDGREGVVLLETLQYWLPLPDQPRTLLFTFATPNLAAAEQMVEQFDILMEHIALSS